MLILYKNARNVRVVLFRKNSNESKFHRYVYLPGEDFFMLLVVPYGGGRCTDC